MAPSPRKSTRSTFNNTWHETDAAFLDPTSLPLPKAPRAWERKTQVTVSRDGKQKKVFRRYTTRSRTADTADTEEGDEEENDSRSRAVKKLQRMSPGAMEKNASMAKGKRHAFKATRWDRRKSVLPRKKIAPIEEPFIDMDEPIDSEEITTATADATNDSASESDMGDHAEEVSAIIPQVEEGDKRRATFRFTSDGQDLESANIGHAEAPGLWEESKSTPSMSGMEQDGPVEFTFRSPVKAASACEPYLFTENTATSPKVEQESTMRFLFRSPSKCASPIKHVELLMPASPSLEQEQDSTMHMLFRSPNVRTSPFNRVRFNAESTPSPGVEEDATRQKMPRSPIKNTPQARHIQFTEEMSPTPVKNITPARHNRFADAASPPSSIEHDGTMQSLFRSPSKATFSDNQSHLSEDTKVSPLPQPEVTDALDSEMSDLEDQSNTTTLCDSAADSALSTITIENGADKEDSLQEREVATPELVMSEPMVPEHNIESSVVAAIDVSLEEERYVGVSADNFTEFEDQEDTEMSEITFNLDFRFSPKKPSTFGENEVATVEESCEQENTITEASLQLDLQRDVDMTEEEEIYVSVEKEDPEASVLSEVAALYEEDNTGDEDNTTRDVATALNLAAEMQHLESVSSPIEQDASINIAEGLTLALSTPSSATPKPRRLRSLSPPPQEETGPDDYTMTVALDDDTAILKDFLTRAAANKANKVETIARRTSLINRRESGAVRHALASPRKILEDKDPNSPSKYDNDVTFDLTQTLTLSADQHSPHSPTTNQVDTEDTEDGKSSKSSRRSTRTRKSRLPAPASASAPQPPQGPKSIAVRRADGTEPIILKRTEAQELGLLTRSNTRKNKQGAFAVSVKLFSLNTEATKNKPEATSSQSANHGAQILAIDPTTGKKNVRWDQTLAYFQEGTDTQANMKAEVESLATPDELSLPLSTSSTKSKIKVPKDKSSNSTPKIRRIRGLGATNGTPGKGLLGTEALLPDDIVGEKEVHVPAKEIQRLLKPKTSRVKKMSVASSTEKAVHSPLTLATSLPTLETAVPATEAGKESTKLPKERKSRLAMPKKVTLPQPVSSSVTVEGKENQQARSLTAATPKKGIPMPHTSIPSAPGVETGLPRRRARKM